MTTRTVRRMLKCHCQVASSKKLQQMLWRRIDIARGTYVGVRCYQCGAVWKTSAAYARRLPD